jgi:hypothetical protein
LLLFIVFVFVVPFPFPSSAFAQGFVLRPVFRFPFVDCSHVSEQRIAAARHSAVATPILISVKCQYCNKDYFKYIIALVMSTANQEEPEQEPEPVSPAAVAAVEMDEEGLRLQGHCWYEFGPFDCRISVCSGWEIRTSL